MIYLEYVLSTVVSWNKILENVATSEVTVTELTLLGARFSLPKKEEKK